MTGRALPAVPVLGMRLLFLAVVFVVMFPVSLLLFVVCWSVEYFTFGRTKQ